MHTIYGIVDDNGVIRYVGTTKLTMNKRMSLHWYFRGKRQSPLNQWLASLPERPSYVVLETVADDDHIERETAWIMRYGLDNLLNVGLGGTGGARWGDEARERLIAGNRSAEGRQKNRASQLGKKHTPETRAKISASLRRVKER